jgi:hypothetical protein
MRRNYPCLLTFLAVVIFGAQAVSGQFTITIPKWPKISKPRTEPPKETQTTTTPETARTAQQTENKPVAAKDKCTESGWLDIHIGKIGERQKEVDEFTPERGWFTRDFTYDHLLFAVSPKEKEKWLKDAKAVDLKDCPNLVAAFDKLAASTATKLPLYVPNPQAFKIRNAPEERMMKTILTDPTRYKIYKIGLNQASWLISKNDFGLPTARYKQGMIYLRDTKSDHPYCYMTYVNILQDYSGGGTYGASYPLFIKDVLAGCPAGQ